MSAESDAAARRLYLLAEIRKIAALAYDLRADALTVQEDQERRLLALHPLGKPVAVVLAAPIVSLKRTEAGAGLGVIAGAMGGLFPAFVVDVREVYGPALPYGMRLPFRVVVPADKVLEDPAAAHYAACDLRDAALSAEHQARARAAEVSAAQVIKRLRDDWADPAA